MVQPRADRQVAGALRLRQAGKPQRPLHAACLLYTSDAADERSSVDLGGRRIIKKKREIEMRSDKHTIIQQQRLNQRTYTQKNQRREKLREKRQ